MAIALSGIASSIGKYLTQYLKEFPVRVIGSLTDKKDIEEVEQLHLNVKSTFLGDLSNQKQAIEALTDCEFLVIASSEFVGSTRLGIPLIIDPNIKKQELQLIRSAKLNGIKHVIKIASCSNKMISSTSPVGIGRTQWEIEKEIKSTGIPYTLIHPSMLMQSLLQGTLQEMICGRRISLAMGKSAISFIDARDICEVIAKLIQTEAKNKTYVITGDQNLSWNSVASILSKELNDKVVYSSVPLFARYMSLWMKGLNADDISNTMEISKFYSNQEYEELTDTMKTITGKKPISFESFIKEHRDCWPYSGFL